MPVLKCPRCQEPIEISEASAAVRCPSCLEEFKVNRRSPMADQVEQFRQQIAAQDGQDTPASGVKLRPMPSEPQQPIAATPVQATPRQAYAPAGQYRSPHEVALARRRAAARRKQVWAIVGIVLIALLVPLGVLAWWYHEHRQPRIVGPDGRPIDEQAQASSADREPVRVDPPRDRGSAIGPVPVTVDDMERTTPRPTGTEDIDNPVGPPPTPTPTPSPRPDSGVTARTVDPIKAHPNDDTHGFIAGMLVNDQSRVLRSATVIGRILDRNGNQMANDVRHDVRWVGANDGARFTMEVRGIRVGEIGAVNLSVSQPVEFAEASARMLGIEGGSVELTGGTDGEPFALAGRIQNTTDSEVFGVRLWIEVYTHLGERAYVREARPGRSTIRAGASESFRITMPNDTFVDARGLRPIVRAVGFVGD